MLDHVRSFSITFSPEHNKPCKKFKKSSAGNTGEARYPFFSKLHRLK